MNQSKEFWEPESDNKKPKMDRLAAEQRTWQPQEPKKSPTQQRQNRPKVPKIKEPNEEKNGKKSSAQPPTGAVSALSNAVTTVSGRINEVVAKGKALYAKMRTNKVMPIQAKVQSRHLELEPLCCLSSCLVRGGCCAVAVFELFYVVATVLIVIGGMSRGGFSLWKPSPTSINEYFGHHLFYYFVVAYDAVLLLSAIGLTHGLMNFSKILLQIHYPFCYFSLVVNILFLSFSIWALSSPGPYKWTPTNVLLVLCFAMMIPLQIWGSTVVKSCRDFFALIHVFLALAEA